MKIRISLFQNNIVFSKDLFSKGDTEGTRSLSLWLQLPKYSNKSSKLPGQTTQLGMCLEILNLPSLINFLSWIWVAIMSQLTSSNANEMQRDWWWWWWQCVWELFQCREFNENHTLKTTTDYLSHASIDWLALSDEAFLLLMPPPHHQESRQDKSNLIIKKISLVFSYYS